MRLALLLTTQYTRRPNLGFHPCAPHDSRLVREKLAECGFEFRVVEIPLSTDAEALTRLCLQEHNVRPDDVVLIYLSAFSHLDDAGDLTIELDQPAGAPSEDQPTRMSVARLRSLVNSAGVRGAVVVMDLVCVGDGDAVEASHHVAAARRVFAPELSGYSMLCSVRTKEQSVLDRSGASPFTSLWIRALDKPEARNAVGAVIVSCVINQMREDPDLYTDVPCFALIAGRRDLPLYSIVEALKHPRPSVPPSQRLSTPPSSRARVGVDDLLSSAEAFSAQGRWEAAVDEYKKALLLFGDEKSKRRADVYVRLGEIKVAQGRRREAIVCFRKAIGFYPAHAHAMGALADLLASDGEFQEAVRLRRDQLSHLEDLNERYAVYLALAEDCEKQGNMADTLQALESARALRPEEHSVLARLALIYESTGKYNKVVDIKVVIAQLKSQPEQVARSLVLAADFAKDRGGMPERAREIYELALDADPLTPRASDECLALVQRANNPIVLEQALVAQASRLAKAHAAAAEAHVWRSLAELRRNQLRNLGSAIAAMDRCVTLVPNDVEARVELAEMLVQVDQMQAASQLAEIAAFHAPGRAETYHTLHRWLAKTGNSDRAWLATAALIQLGEADLDEQMYFEQYKPSGLVRPTRSLADTAWQDLYPDNHDVHVRTILNLVAPVGIEHKLARLQQQQVLPSLDPKTRQDPEMSTVSLTRTFVWASKVLNVPLPDIYVADSVPGGIAAVPAASPTALVGKSVLSGHSVRALAFLVGRDLTYYRPSHYILVLYSTLQELTALLLAAIKVVRPNIPIPESSRPEASELISAFKARLDDATMNSLSLAVDQFDQAGGAVDLASWARTIELTATRAGLLLCGDLGEAATIMEKDDRCIADLSAVDRMNDLLPFSVSEAYGELRAQIGMTSTKPDSS